MLRSSSGEHSVTHDTIFICRSFVHDPKMANEPTVSASVKLQYIGRNGDRYVVARCMEAKQMAKTITGKMGASLLGGPTLYLLKFETPNRNTANIPLNC